MPEKRIRIYRNVAKRIERDKSDVLEQMKKTPIVQLACERANVARSTYYRWREIDPAFAEASDAALKSGIETVNDMAESQLMAAIKDRNMAAIVFWLKHHHPTYRTKLEVNGFVHHFAERLSPDQEKVVRDAVRLASFTIPLSSLYEQQSPTENTQQDA